MADELLYLNGEVMPLREGKISVEDRGFQLGDGVYEVVKVMNGQAVWLREHLDRLRGSLGSIKVGGVLEHHRFEEIVPDLIGRSGVVDGLVYIQVTRGVEPRDFEIHEEVEPTVLAYARSKLPLTEQKILAGEVLCPVEDRRWALCGIKAIDLLAAVLAKEEARCSGADEALFVTSDGIVREGGSSNVFAIIGGVLRTHPADGRILDGITRRHVLELARSAGQAVEETAFGLSDITAVADPGLEVFVASTLKDIMPIIRVGEVDVGAGKPGDITLRLSDLFRTNQAAAVGLAPPNALSSPS